MENVFKCQAHNDVALYINTKPFTQKPILLCQRCILSCKDDAVLLSEFMLQFNVNSQQKSMLHSYNEVQFEENLANLSNQLYYQIQTTIDQLMKKLKNQWNQQQQQIIDVQSYLEQSDITKMDFENLKLNPEKYLQYFINVKLSTSQQDKWKYLQQLLLNLKEPDIPIADIVDQWTVGLNQNLQKSNLSNMINVDFPLNITQQIMSLTDNDFQFTNTININHYHPRLSQFVQFIKVVNLTLIQPIKLNDFSQLTNLQELTIKMDNCNLGKSGIVTIPNLQKLHFDLSNNYLSELDRISLPSTITDFSLNLSNNIFSFDCLKIIENSVSRLLLDNLQLNFNGYSLQNNQIFDEGMLFIHSLGLSYLNQIIRRQQLTHLFLGLGRCGITDVGIQFSLIPLLQSQTKLQILKLDLYSNFIKRISDFEEVINNQIFTRSKDNLLNIKLILIKIR